MVDSRQQRRAEEEPVRHGNNADVVKEVTIAYTNVDGLLSKRLELTDYLREKKPDIVCIVETKLTKDMDLILDGNFDYNTWRNDRKDGKGGGVIVMTKQSLKVAEVKYETEYSENVCI